MASRTKSPEPMRVNTLAAIAEHFDVSPQTVDRWKLRGMPGQRGAYCLRAIGRWIVSRQAGNASDPMVAKHAARKLAAETDAAIAKSMIVQFRARAMAGELLDRSAVQHEAEKMVVMVRNELEALPQRLTELLPVDVRIDAEITLENVIHRTLHRLAGTADQYKQAVPVKAKQTRKRKEP